MTPSEYDFDVIGDPVAPPPVPLSRRPPPAPPPASLDPKQERPETPGR